MGVCNGLIFSGLHNSIPVFLDMLFYNSLKHNYLQGSIFFEGVGRHSLSEYYITDYLTTHPNFTTFVLSEFVKLLHNAQNRCVVFYYIHENKFRQTVFIHTFKTVSIIAHKIFSILNTLYNVFCFSFEDNQL